jgi:metallo-beta-lactamase family protein
VSAAADPRHAPPGATLTFLGAAGEVTGSATLVETGSARVLLDCGLFQGRGAQARNRAPSGADAARLDAVLLTHAHLDHSGRLPLLVREGYAGRVEATDGTLELARVLLEDAARLQEQEAERESRRAVQQAPPLYDTADAARAIARLRERPFGALFDLAPGVRARYRPAGHILGAAHVELWVGSGADQRLLVVSGDVGRTRSGILRPPDPPPAADLVLLESTYGDRDHRSEEETLEELADILRAAAAGREKVIVPSFAVGRAQELLHAIALLEREGRVPVRDVFLDSPMAIAATELYRRHPALLDPELLRGGGPLVPARTHYVRDWQQSMALNWRDDAVVIASSGMCEGGRILHHLRHALGRAGVHLVIVGFQAEGTLGRALVDGATRVRILGEEVEVRARRHTLGGFSAHAGRSELLAWLERVGGSPAVVLVHGEAGKREALAAALAARGRQVLLPGHGDRVVLAREGPRLVAAGRDQNPLRT